MARGVFKAFDLNSIAHSSRETCSTVEIAVANTTRKKTSFELNEIRRNGRYSLPLSQGATPRQSTAYRADKRLEFQLRSSSAVAPPPQRKDTELGKDRQNICITVADRE